MNKKRIRINKDKVLINFLKVWSFIIEDFSIIPFFYSSVHQKLFIELYKFIQFDS